MSRLTKATAGLIALSTLTLAGCASTLENYVQSPTVALSNVQVASLGLNAQTFMLSFDVSNPNSFSLPVKSVSYGVKLNGERFASGTTANKFTVAASDSTQFAISVDLDLLRSAPRLFSIVRESMREDVTYELDGQFAVDIPLAPPVNFNNSGTIRLVPASL